LKQQQQQQQQQRIMRKTLVYFLVAVFFIVSLPSTARSLTVTPLTSVTQVVNSLFGSCSLTPQVSGATLIGSLDQVGFFTGGNTTNGIQLSPNGVVFSSGKATTAVGPNNTPSSSDSIGTPGDASIANSFDASGLSMTLTWPSVPVGTYSFDMVYVWGSDEYPEYVGDIYNDQFSFTIDGVNCALIQGEPVTFFFTSSYS